MLHDLYRYTVYYIISQFFIETYIFYERLYTLVKIYVRCINMTKTREQVEEKMRERVSTAGKYVKEGMNAAEDPIEVLLKDPKGYAEKLLAGLTDAIRRGNYQVGLKAAQERNAWKGAIDRAASHFEERANDMVTNAMSSYDKRMTAIEAAKRAISNMPKATRVQRIARSTKYQTVVGEEMDKAFGRKS